jgi:hypothetical protein
MPKRYDTDSSPWDDFNKTKKMSSVEQWDQVIANSHKRVADIQQEMKDLNSKRRADNKRRKKNVKKNMKSWETRFAYDKKAKGVFPLTRRERALVGEPNRVDRAVRGAAKSLGRVAGVAGVASELAFPSKTAGRNSDLAAQRHRLRGGGGKVKYHKSSRADAAKAIAREVGKKKRA